MNNCTLRNSDMCLRKNIIYKITCNTCKYIYVGSTIRHLHTRIKEHLTSKASSVYKHLRSCNNNNHISVKILASDKDECNIRLREAIHIRKLKPKINNQEELYAFSEFLYG